ncbi:hypothetical protein HYH02_009223 [Chlamydomonas schloesseri]|uniref:Uncharacterized protein n=1 Tax=Chlamydomonas schloesseri TaxID=2026947 RepID=A0A836B0W1_9CHLO|nr:hypothetical protein HYH02_009223 [Chlamydomonas schloesseri]|eukprot:KAG2444024.1 hypothetical protein HYH02_009223 [Chlamydomonas schloesseri]
MQGEGDLASAATVRRVSERLLQQHNQYQQPNSGNGGGAGAGLGLGSSGLGTSGIPGTVTPGGGLPYSCAGIYPPPSGGFPTGLSDCPLDPAAAPTFEDCTCAAQCRLMAMAVQCATGFAACQRTCRGRNAGTTEGSQCPTSCVYQAGWPGSSYSFCKCTEAEANRCAEGVVASMEHLWKDVCAKKPTRAGGVVACPPPPPQPCANYADLAAAWRQAHRNNASTNGKPMPPMPPMPPCVPAPPSPPSPPSPRSPKPPSPKPPSSSARSPKPPSPKPPGPKRPAPAGGNIRPSPRTQQQ